MDRGTKGLSKHRVWYMNSSCAEQAYGTLTSIPSIVIAQNHLIENICREQLTELNGFQWEVFLSESAVLKKK